MPFSTNDNLLNKFFIQKNMKLFIKFINEFTQMDYRPELSCEQLALGRVKKLKVKGCVVAESREAQEAI